MAGKLGPGDGQGLGEEHNAHFCLKESCALLRLSHGGKLSHCRCHDHWALLVAPLKGETCPLFCSHFCHCQSL